MIFVPFLQLRRRPLRRCVTLLAACAIFMAGLAQAAHFHKDAPARGVDTHLSCLLCMHADRWAGPPELPAMLSPVADVDTLTSPLTTTGPGQHRVAPYEARGPPAV
jgi:hypothetical protein